MIRYSVLAIFILLLMAPLYVMVVGSFTEIEGFLKRPPTLWLRNPTMRNYDIVLTGQPIGTWIMNTAIVAVSTMVLALITVVLAGYCFSRYASPVTMFIYAAFLFSVMVPKNVLIIPLVVIFRHLRLSGTRAAVIIPSVFYPIGIAIYKTYLDKISTTYDDCARMDGAGEWYIITRIIAPMSRPAIAAVATFVMMGSLQDFLWQFIVLQKESRRTLITGLMHAVYKMGGTDMGINPIGTKMAAGVIIFVPLLLIYIVLHKYYLEGVTSGGIKE